MTTLQEEGISARLCFGIDGTMGDAQDVPHSYIGSAYGRWCRLCGLGLQAKVHWRTYAVEAPPMPDLAAIEERLDRGYAGCVNKLAAAAADVIALVTEVERLGDALSALGAAFDELLGRITSAADDAVASAEAVLHPQEQGK